MADINEQRFLKFKSGAVYRYSPVLAKRRDAMVVDGYAAAQYYRSLGVENDITKAFPEREIDKGAIPEKAQKPPPRPVPKKKDGKAAVVVSDDTEDPERVIEELLNGGTDV